MIICLQNTKCCFQAKNSLKKTKFYESWDKLIQEKFRFENHKKNFDFDD